MRKVDCLYKLDTPVACARRHQQDDNEVHILACQALVQLTAGTRLGITRGFTWASRHEAA